MGDPTGSTLMLLTSYKHLTDAQLALLRVMCVLIAHDIDESVETQTKITFGAICADCHIVD